MLLPSNPSAARVDLPAVDKARWPSPVGLGRLGNKKLLEKASLRDELKLDKEAS